MLIFCSSDRTNFLKDYGYENYNTLRNNLNRDYEISIFNCDDEFTYFKEDLIGHPIKKYEWKKGARHIFSVYIIRKEDSKMVYFDYLNFITNKELSDFLESLKRNYSVHNEIMTELNLL